MEADAVNVDQPRAYLFAPENTLPQQYGWGIASKNVNWRFLGAKKSSDYSGLYPPGSALWRGDIASPNAIKLMKKREHLI